MICGDRLRQVPALLLVMWLPGCGASIGVLPEAGTVITAPGLVDCDGMTVLLIVQSTDSPERVDVEATIRDGGLVFTSRDLRSVDLERDVSLEMSIRSRPRSSCELEYLAAYITGSIRLTPDGDRRYTVSAREFRRL